MHPAEYWKHTGMVGAGYSGGRDYGEHGVGSVLGAFTERGTLRDMKEELCKTRRCHSRV